MYKTIKYVTTGVLYNKILLDPDPSVEQLKGQLLNCVSKASLTLQGVTRDHLKTKMQTLKETLYKQPDNDLHCIMG